MNKVYLYLNDLLISVRKDSKTWDEVKLMQRNSEMIEIDHHFEYGTKSFNYPPPPCVDH